MIIVKAVCTPKPGQADEARAAARELMDHAGSHQGLTAYLWSEDETTGDLIDYEVHEDEAALLNHIAVSDLSRMHASMTIVSVELIGETPSPTLQSALSKFGSYKHYPAV